MADHRSGRRAPLAILLATSVTLNLVLVITWALRSPAGAAPPPAAAPIPPPPAAPIPDAVAPPCTPAAPPAAPPARTAPVPDAGAQACRERVAQLERDLARLAHRLGGQRDRFDRGSPDPASEDRIRPHLSRILGEAKRIVSWQLSCRDRTCRIVVRTPWERRPEDTEWMRPLQIDAELRAWTSRMGFGGGGPDHDPATRDGVWEHEVLFDVRPEREQEDPLRATIRKLVADLERPELLDLCTRGYAERGTFGARFTLGHDGLTFRFGGSLAPTPAGACLADRIRAIVTERLGSERVLEPYTALVTLTSPPAPNPAPR